jgi:hypothetical protein
LINKKNIVSRFGKIGSDAAPDCTRSQNSHLSFHAFLLPDECIAPSIIYGTASDQNENVQLQDKSIGLLTSSKNLFNPLSRQQVGE